MFSLRHFKENYEKKKGSCKTTNISQGVPIPFLNCCKIGLLEYWLKAKFEMSWGVPIQAKCLRNFKVNQNCNKTRKKS